MADRRSNKNNSGGGCIFALLFFMGYGLLLLFTSKDPNERKLGCGIMCVIFVFIICAGTGLSPGMSFVITLISVAVVAGIIMAVGSTGNKSSGNKTSENKTTDNKMTDHKTLDNRTTKVTADDKLSQDKAADYKSMSSTITGKKTIPTTKTFEESLREMEQQAKRINGMNK